MLQENLMRRLNEFSFFDSWSEGPFSAYEVESFGRSTWSEFHSTGGGPSFLLLREQVLEQLTKLSDAN